MKFYDFGHLSICPINRIQYIFSIHVKSPNHLTSLFFAPFHVVDVSIRLYVILATNKHSFSLLLTIYTIHDVCSVDGGTMNSSAYQQVTRSHSHLILDSIGLLEEKASATKKEETRKITAKLSPWLIIQWKVLRYVRVCTLDRDDASRVQEKLENMRIRLGCFLKARYQLKIKSNLM